MPLLHPVAVGNPAHHQSRQRHRKEQNGILLNEHVRRESVNGLLNTPGPDLDDDDDDDQRAVTPAWRFLR